MLEKRLIFPGDAAPAPRFAGGRGADAVSTHPRQRRKVQYPTAAGY